MTDSAGKSPPKGVSMNLEDLSPAMRAQVKASKPDDEDDFSVPAASKTAIKKSDADHHRALAANDQKMAAAYEAGRKGLRADPDFDDDERAAHSSGVEEAAQPAASPPSSFPAVPSRSRQLAGQVAGANASDVSGLAGTLKSKAQGAPLILGMVGYCLALNWFRYGWPGVTGWFTAKFENKVTLNVAGAPAATTKTPAGEGVTVTGGVTGTGKNDTTQGVYQHGK